MKIKYIFFDLDGTLLPMDQEKFLKSYFENITKHFIPFGFEPKKLIDSINKGTYAMFKNNGEKTNEDVFWDVFSSIYGNDIINQKQNFEEFYKTDFMNTKETCGFNPKSNEVIKKLKQQGYKIVLATNPLFPKIATYSRVIWGGLDSSDFELITTYENSSYCKPNLNYYLEILNRFNIDPIECLMVGNDIGEDMITKKLGMKVFLLPEFLINKVNEDIDDYPHGTFDDLLKYIEKIKNDEN